jgi:uncharacterized membrane protein
MKTLTFIGQFAFSSHHLLSRDRLAYLLRAARSRRKGNVARTGHGYFIRDCDYSIAI